MADLLRETSLVTLAPAPTTTEVKPTSSTTTTSTAPVAETAAPSPIESLTAASTTSYAPPATAMPTMTTTEAVVAAASLPKGTLTGLASDTTVPQTIQPIGTVTGTITEQRPTIVPIIPLIPTSAPSGGSGGGGGGFGAPESDSKSAEASGVKKKSWLPVILIVSGILVIASKYMKKKAKA